MFSNFILFSSASLLNLTDAIIADLISSSLTPNLIAAISFEIN